MGEDDRRKLYETLLYGLAEVAQRQLCVAGKMHAWGPWVRSRLKPDFEIVPLRADAAVSNAVMHVQSRRKCEACGAEQWHDG